MWTSAISDQNTSRFGLDMGICVTQWVILTQNVIDCCVLRMRIVGHNYIYMNSNTIWQTFRAVQLIYAMNYSLTPCPFIDTKATPINYTGL